MFRFAKFFSGLFALLAVFTFPIQIFAASPERVIVVFKPGTNLSSRQAILEKYHAEKLKTLQLINADALAISTNIKAQIAKEASVLRVDPDVEVFALETATPRVAPTAPIAPTAPTIPTIGSLARQVGATAASTQTIPWGVAKIQADIAWATTTGSGVRVAVIDTGIDRDHPDLKDNLAGCVNFIYSFKTCEDDNGHGTHVSGIIAAENNTVGVVGVAPNARIYSLKSLNSRGSGFLSDIIEALDWSTTHGIQVVNMSLGTSSDVASFRDAVARVNAAGITQIAAAGNSGPGGGTVLFPAKYPGVIVVAASSSTNDIPSWSSRGPEVDITAPGDSIKSTFKGNAYKVMSGTSMATPHVTGVVALRLFLKPGESPSQIESILKSNSDPLPFDPAIVGSGLINAVKVISAP